MATDKHNSHPLSGRKFGPSYSREDHQIFQTLDRLERLDVAILCSKGVRLTDAITQVALGISEPIPNKLDLGPP